MYTVFSRSLLALVTAFAVAAVICPALIPMFFSLSEGKKYKRMSLRTQLRGGFSPAMGGIAILFAVVVSTILWGRDSYSFVLVALLMAGSFTLVGFIDDFLRTVGLRAEGIKPWQMLIIQAVLCLGFAIWLYNLESVRSTVWADKIEMGIFYIPYAMLVMLVCLNAVSLTDSFAGLSCTVTSIYALFMAALLCMTVISATSYAQYQLLLDQSALSVFAMALAGGCMGFLIFNLPPSRISLGRTGTHMLGGAIAAIALMSRTTLLLPLMGLCFTVSVIKTVWIAVSRIIHKRKQEAEHALPHEQLKERGLPESKIVSIYGITTAICSAAALLIHWFIK